MICLHCSVLYSHEGPFPSPPAAQRTNRDVNDLARSGHRLESEPQNQRGKPGPMGAILGWSLLSKWPSGHLASIILGNPARLPAWPPVLPGHVTASLSSQLSQPQTA